MNIICISWYTQGMRIVTLVWHTLYNLPFLSSNALTGILHLISHQYLPQLCKGYNTYSSKARSRHKSNLELHNHPVLFFLHWRIVRDPIVGKISNAAKKQSIGNMEVYFKIIYMCLSSYYLCNQNLTWLNLFQVLKQLLFFISLVA